MNFPDSPNIGQLYGWGDFLWTYIGNNKWDLLWIRGRGNMLTWFIAYIEFAGQNGNFTRGNKLVVFDAT